MITFAFLEESIVVVLDPLPFRVIDYKIKVFLRTSGMDFKNIHHA